jgi:putative ABC transport system substrate-binding protein
VPYSFIFPEKNYTLIKELLMLNISRRIHKNKQTTLLVLITIFFLISIFASADAFEVVAVKSSELKPYNDTLEGFRKACNCTVIEITEVEGQSLPKQISRISPVAVLAIGTDAFKKVKSIKDLPVIYTMVIPSEVDISLQKNISGVSMDISPETYINTMVEIFPKAKRIGLIYNPQHTGSFVKKAIESAHDRGINIVSKIARNLGDIPDLIEEMKDKIDIFWMLPDSTVVTPETFNYMLLFSFQKSVPVFTFSRKYVETGALAALNIDPFDMGVQAGEIAMMLLEGHKDTIRVYARKKVLIINKKIANKLGVTIKNGILRRAEVIE